MPAAVARGHSCWRNLCWLGCGRVTGLSVSIDMADWNSRTVVSLRGNGVRDREFLSYIDDGAKFLARVAYRERSLDLHLALVAEGDEIRGAIRSGLITELSSAWVGRELARDEIARSSTSMTEGQRFQQADRQLLPRSRLQRNTAELWICR